MKIPKSIDRIHVLYLGFIVLLTLGYISGFIFFDNNYSVNIISVSSGVFSIAIGMLAIAIALYQGFTQGTSIQKINDSADRVNEATIKLNSIDFAGIDKKISSIHEIVSSNDLGANSSGKIGSLKLDEVAIETLFFSGKVQKILGYSIFQAYEKDKSMDLFKLGELLVSILGNSNISEVYVGVSVLYTSFLNDLEEVEISFNGDFMEPHKLNEHFIELARKKEGIEKEDIKKIEKFIEEQINK